VERPGPLPEPTGADRTSMVAFLKDDNPGRAVSRRGPPSGPQAQQKQHRQYQRRAAGPSRSRAATQVIGPLVATRLHARSEVGDPAAARVPTAAPDAWRWGSDNQVIYRIAKVDRVPISQSKHPLKNPWREVRPLWRPWTAAECLET